MGSLQGPVICQNISAKQRVVRVFPPVTKLIIPKNIESEAWGSKSNVLRKKAGVNSSGRNSRRLKNKKITSSLSHSSDGSMAGNFKENDDEDYLDSSIVDAVEVKSSRDGFLVKMRDGSYMRCVHNNPQGENVMEYAPHPAMVLKMEDGSGLLLPIIVLEMPSVLLMAAVHNIQIARPTIYQVIREMIGKMGYEVKLVRVTKRVREAYFSKLYLNKIGNEDDCISFDLRPSDAINIAVRCKAPIQVNRILAFSDGMKVIDSRVLTHTLADGTLSSVSEMDRPDGQTNTETKEFNLLQNMFNAAYEERYNDAAQWRDKLTEFRSQKNWT